MTGVDTWLSVRRRLKVGALYAGGILGPFGGGMVSPVLPEIGADFHTSTGNAALSLTTYMIPFAGLMLVSGTLGQRWGAARSTRTAYVVYFVMSLVCVLPGPFWLFLLARAFQGAANAFTTPLLLASVAEITPANRLGRALGLFGSLQAAGQTSAPLVTGLVAAASWRYAFVGSAVVAGVLAVVGLPATARRAGQARPVNRLRSAFRPAVLWIGLAGFLGWGCLGGLAFLVSFRAQDAFGLSAGSRGALLTGFGIVGMLTARLVGHLVDRRGGRWSVSLGMTVGAVLLVGVGTVPSAVAVAVLWALCGVASQMVLVGVNSLALSGGANRGGAVSVVQACRFMGAALTPAAFTPVYHASALTSFLLPAGLLVAGTPSVLIGRRSRQQGPKQQAVAEPASEQHPE
ncbi:MAG TPA: MFS transporter [Pseudonocardiaceae bacterium]|nr:MFS transporter [Pseudonocardiaceae bacterium]